MEEEWRKIEETTNHYISNFGNIKNFSTNNILIQQKDKGGYCHVSYRLPNSGRKLFRRRIHRLVAKAFIPNPDNLPLVHHIDLNPSNNYVNNLKWVTNMENCQSKNKTCNIGYICLFIKNGNTYYQAGFTHYGKKYEKKNKDREICEEWLKNRRYEIDNELEITKDKKY